MREMNSSCPPLAIRSASLHAAEFLRRLVEHEQRAFGDAEIGAVQMQFAALDRGSHERKRQQVFQAAEHRGLLDPDGEILHRLAVALLDLLARLDEHRHPFADEVAGRQRRDIVDEGADAAALGVAEHHDVFYAQHRNRVFQRRRDAVRVAVRLVDRHQIGDVAHHEQFAGAGIEDHFRRDPGIAAADHHHFGGLAALGQFAVARLLGRQPLRGEGPVAFDQMVRETPTWQWLTICRQAGTSLSGGSLKCYRVWCEIAKGTDP